MQIEYLALRKKLMRCRPLFAVIHKVQDFRRAHREKVRVRRFRKYGYEIAAKLYDALEDSGFEYFYTYGSLLGLIRDGGFIPYDNDLDLGILKTEDFSWSKFRNRMEQEGFRRHREFAHDGKVTEQSYLYRNVNIDFFLYTRKEDRLLTHSYFHDRDKEYESVRHASVEEYRQAWFGGFQYVEARGIRFRVPARAEQFLEEVYEDTWKSPIPGWDYTQAKARAELEGKVGIKTTW